MSSNRRLSLDQRDWNAGQVRSLTSRLFFQNAQLVAQLFLRAELKEVVDARAIVMSPNGREHERALAVALRRVFVIVIQKAKVLPTERRDDLDDRRRHSAVTHHSR